MKKILKLFKKKNFVSALFTIVGSVALVFGRELMVSDAGIDAIVTLAGMLCVALGYTTALVTPNDEEDDNG